MRPRNKKKRKKNKLWSVQRIRHPKYPALLLRITEVVPGKDLYGVLRGLGKPRWTSLHRTRASLGATGRDQEQAARAIAMDVIEGFATGTPARDEPAPLADLTIGQLADRYEARGFFGRTECYRKQQCSSIRRIAAYLGATRPVTSLKTSDLQAYYVHRTTSDGVRAAARGDLVALKIGCNWAADEGLLGENPLARIKLAKITGKHTPRRPWATKERYEKLKAVADRLPPVFGVLLELAWHTGHRIGAILGLRCQDVDFTTSENCPYGAITWYAGRGESNKVYEHTVAMRPEVREALVHWREQCPGIGTANLFPQTRNALAGKEKGRHSVKGLLRRAEELAGVPHEPQGGWHSFRRGFATMRKPVSLTDLMAAGGWRDAGTARQYQQAEPTGTRAAVMYGG